MIPNLSTALLSATRALPVGDPPNTLPPLAPATDDILNNFANFGNTSDVLEKAKYLGRKGMAGAWGMIHDAETTDKSTTKGLLNAQSDWKSAAIATMLMRARKIGLRTPTEILNNKAALIGALSPGAKEGVTHPDFANIHPNFWTTFADIVKDRYDNEAASQQANQQATVLNSPLLKK